MVRNSEYPDHRGPKSKGEVVAGCVLMVFLVLTVLNSLGIVALALFAL
jgi:hypothetical protein